MPRRGDEFDGTWAGGPPTCAALRAGARETAAAKRGSGAPAGRRPGARDARPLPSRAHDGEGEVHAAPRRPKPGPRDPRRRWDK